MKIISKDTFILDKNIYTGIYVDYLLVIRPQDNIKL